MLLWLKLKCNTSSVSFLLMWLLTYCCKAWRLSENGSQYTACLKKPFSAQYIACLEQPSASQYIACLEQPSAPLTEGTQCYARSLWWSSVGSWRHWGKKQRASERIMRMASMVSSLLPLLLSFLNDALSVENDSIWNISLCKIRVYAQSLACNLATNW